MNHRSLLFCGFLLFIAAPVGNACSVSAGSMSFGSINPLESVAQDASSMMEIICPTTTSYTVALSPGGGSYATRIMTTGALTLAYNLYADGAREQTWGDGTGGTAIVNGVADSAGTVHTIYGRVPSQPLTVPGAYSDNIVITVTY